MSTVASRLGIWSSRVRIMQTYQKSQKVDDLVHAEDVLRWTLSSVLDDTDKGEDGVVADDATANSDKASESTSFGGSSFTIEEASSDSEESRRIEKWEYEYTPRAAIRPRLYPWPRMSHHRPPVYNQRRWWDSDVSSSIPVFNPFAEEDTGSFWCVPGGGLYRPGEASMALWEGSEAVGESPKVSPSPIGRPLRPLQELSTERSSASPCLRAPITTLEVASPGIQECKLQTTEELFDAFLEDMRQPMPAFHFVESP